MALKGRSSTVSPRSALRKFLNAPESFLFTTIFQRVRDAAGGGCAPHVFSCEKRACRGPPAPALADGSE